MASNDTMVTRWWWIRHAPVTDQMGKLYGALDVDCDCGERPAFERLAKALPTSALWVTSHLKRTHQTAAAIQDAGHDGPTPVFLEALGEQSFGHWQGHRWNEIAEKFAEESRAFWQDPTRTAPMGGESFSDLITRCGKAIDALNQQQQGRDIIAVTHGGTIRAAIAHALRLNPEDAMAIVIDNLSLTRIDHLSIPALSGKGSSWSVLGINLPSSNFATTGLRP